MNDKRTVTFELSEELWKQLEAAAMHECRSISAQAEWWVKQQLAQSETERRFRESMQRMQESTEKPRRLGELPVPPPVSGGLGWGGGLFGPNRF